MLLRRTLKEPLFHFIAIAIGVYVIFSLANPDSDDALSNRITVRQADLFEFVQYQAKAFDMERVQEEYELLTAQQLERLIEDYVREEALYREARTLGLDKGDYLQRLRLVRKLEVAVGGLVDSEIRPSAEEVDRYFALHQDEYTEPAKVTFAHVFFSNERHGEKSAAIQAERALGDLNNDKVRFDQATAYGDRFLYGVNYVQKDKAYVASHLGHEMSEALFALAPVDRQVWRGIFRSPYGAHAVLVTELTKDYTPKLEDVYERVVADLVRLKQEDEAARAIRDIIAKYEVEISDD